jgi:aryl-alcohol dehydrogenase-like predicted oxidoreductase
MNRRQSLTAIPMLATAILHSKSLRAQPATVLSRAIPSSGERIPALGLGTWQTFDVGTSATERAPLLEVLREFVALGGRVIDSSPMYGRSEEVAGELMRSIGAPDNMFVATKVWTRGEAAGITQMRTSMEKLAASKTKPLDLLQVHNLVDVDTHLATLAAWKREGRIRYVGITHYTESAYGVVAALIEKQKPGAIDFLQINYSVAERTAEQRLLPLAAKRGIAVIVNRPFAGGELLRRLRDVPLPGVAKEIGTTSWAQLLLKFVLSHAAVTCVIPATSKVTHLRDNIPAMTGELPNEKQRAQIVAAVRGCWPGELRLAQWPLRLVRGTAFSGVWPVQVKPRV